MKIGFIGMGNMGYAMLKGILNVVTEIFKNKPDLKEIKKLQKNDFIALGLTAFVMIVLIIILWFIPFTNGFVKSMLPFLK